MNSLVIQLIGAIGYTILAFSYFYKEKKDIVFIQIFSMIALSIHFYLLNGITGAICNIINSIALIIIYFFEKYNLKNKKLLILITIPLLILISLFTYENLFSILPIIAVSIVLISFLLSNENVIRIVGVISAICWLIYAIIYKSYVAIFFEIIIIISTIIAFLKNKNNKSCNKQDMIK